MKKCSNCGKEFLGDASFCTECGGALVEAEPAPVQPNGGEWHYADAQQTEGAQQSAYRDASMEPSLFEDDPRSAFVQKKTDHYIPIFRQLDNGARAKFNWCSFLFTPMWFAYRKMYLWAVIAIAIPFALGLIVGIIIGLSGNYYLMSDDVFNRIGIGIGLAVSIVFGFLGNKIYRDRVDKLVQNTPVDENAKQNYIRSKGGVSVGMMILFIVINIAINAWGQMV